MRHKALRRQLIRNLTGAGVRWWVRNCNEFANIASIANSCNLYRLISSTGPRKLNVVELIEGSDSMLVTPGDTVESVERRTLGGSFVGPLSHWCFLMTSISDGGLVSPELFHLGTKSYRVSFSGMTISVIGVLWGRYWFGAWFKVVSTLTKGLYLLGRVKLPSWDL